MSPQDSSPEPPYTDHEGNGKPHMTEGAQIAVKRINRTLHLLVAATTVLFVSSIVIVLFVAHSAKHTHDALCDLRDDRVKAVQQGNQYLNSHTDKQLSALGFTREQVQSQVKLQQETVDALDSLGC